MIGPSSNDEPPLSYASASCACRYRCEDTDSRRRTHRRRHTLAKPAPLCVAEGVFQPKLDGSRCLVLRAHDIPDAQPPRLEHDSPPARAGAHVAADTRPLAVEGLATTSRPYPERRPFLEALDVKHRTAAGGAFEGGEALFAATCGAQAPKGPCREAPWRPTMRGHTCGDSCSGFKMDRCRSRRLLEHRRPAGATGRAASRAHRPSRSDHRATRQRERAAAQAERIAVVMTSAEDAAVGYSSSTRRAVRTGRGAGDRVPVRRVHALSPAAALSARHAEAARLGVCRGTASSSSPARVCATTARSGSTALFRAPGAHAPTHGDTARVVAYTCA